MVRIRELAEAARRAVHAKSYTAAQYRTLAEGIEAAIAGLMAHCQLPPGVDAELHKVLVQLWSGTGQMKQDGDRAAGFQKVTEGLAWYAAAFEHPGLQPPQ